MKKHKQKKPRNTHTQSLLLPNLQIDLVLMDTLPHFTPKSVIPYPPSNSNANTSNASTATTTHQLTIQTLLPYSNTTLQPSKIIPAPPLAPQPKLLNYSNTPQISTQPINFVRTDKIHSSELPQPIHFLSNINDTPYDISLLSDTSIPDPTNSQFSSPTPSRNANNPFNPPQGPITNTERLLS